MLSSSTYRAHIVQSNGALIFAIIALNRLVQVFGFWPLTVIFHSIYVQLAGMSSKSRACIYDHQRFKFL